MGDSVAIFHHEIGTAPSAVEIDESLPLPNIEDSNFKQAELHERVIGAAPAAENRAAELQHLDGARRGAE